MTEGHQKRLLFVNELQKNFKDQIDFFGFGFNPIDNKKDAIDPYHYSIALENSNMNNWFTEKITDIHIKDRVLGGGSVELGKGNADFEGFFTKLKEFDYKGPFILQAYRDDEGVEIFKKQLDWIRQYLYE